MDCGNIEPGKKIVLFDIDGTLLNAGRGPVRAILRAMEEVYGVEDLLSLKGKYAFAGKTDPEIVRDLLLLKGCSPEAVESGFEKVFDLYIHYLRQFMAEDDSAYLHPGVLRLVRELKDRREVNTGILTGNIERGAEIKLGHFDLRKYFSIGVYGSDSSDRNDLPGILLEKARKLTGYPYTGSEIVIVGDSIFDIRCAGTVGARAIAVVTGTTSREALEAEGPDHIFHDLSRTEQVIEAMTS